MVKRIATAGAWLVVVSAVSCASIVGLDGDFHAKENTTTGDSGKSGAAGTGNTGGSEGGAGSGGDTGGSAPLSCVPDVPPKPPAIADDGNIEFVTALHKINLDETDPDVRVGLDLDGACTCLNMAPGTCVPKANTVCDGPGGIDNALGSLFSTIYQISFMLITSGQLGSAAGDGLWTNLARVRGYNGTADDAKVDVMMYTTPGFGGTPAWKGEDAWPVEESSLAKPPDLDTAIAVASEAYVSGGVLVARLPSQTLRIDSPLFKIKLELVDIVMRAKLVSDDDGLWHLTEGVFAAKWPVTNIFEGIASVRYNSGTKLCTDDDKYVTVKTAICGNVDLRLDGAAGACDALSFGVGFESDPVKLGAVVADAPPPMDGCSAATDPTTDTCDNQ